MKENKHATVIGVIIFACISVVIVGVMWLSRSGVFADDYQVVVYFEDAGGLRTGDGVKVDGTNVGRVSEMRLQPTGANVHISIPKDVPLPKDSRFLLVSDLMTKTISITRGQSEQMLKNGDQVTGEGKDLFGTVNELSELGNKALAGLFTPENIAGFAITIREMSKTVEELRKMLEENRRSFGVTLKNMEEMSSQINLLFQENRQGIRDVMRLLSQSGETFGRLIAQSDSLISDMTNIADRVEKGQGALGKLISEDSIYAEMQGTAQSMRKLADNLSKLSGKTESLIDRTDTLVADIKKNPRKYLKISVF